MLAKKEKSWCATEKTNKLRRHLIWLLRRSGDGVDQIPSLFQKASINKMHAKFLNFTIILSNI